MKTCNLIVFYLLFTLQTALSAQENIMISDPPDKAIIPSNFPALFLRFEDKTSAVRWRVEVKTKYGNLCSYETIKKEEYLDKGCFSKMREQKGSFEIRVEGFDEKMAVKKSFSKGQNIELLSEKIEGNLLFRVVFLGDTNKRRFVDEAMELMYVKFGEEKLNSFFELTPKNDRYCIGCHRLSQSEMYIGLNYRTRGNPNQTGLMIYNISTGELHRMNDKGLDLSEIMLISDVLWFPMEKENPRLAFRTLLNEKGRKTYNLPESTKFKWGMLYTYDVKNEKIEKLKDNRNEYIYTESFDLSPDGRYIAGGISPTDNHYFHLFLFDLMTKTKKILEQANHEYLSSRDPHFSPDGKLITFTRGDYRVLEEWLSHMINKTNDIYIAQVPEGKSKRLSCNADNFNDSQPYITKDSEWLLFVSNRKDGVLSRVYLSKFDRKEEDCSPPVYYPTDDLANRGNYTFNYPMLLTKELRSKFKMVTLE